MTFSYTKKLIFLFSTIVLGTVAGGITTYLNHQSVKINNNWVEHTMYVLYESERVLSLTQDIVLVGQGYVITGDSNYLLPFNTTLRFTYTSVAALKNLVKDNSAQTPRIDSLQQLIFDRIDLSKKNIAIRKLKGFTVTQLLINGYRGIGQIRNLTLRIQAEEKRLLKKRQYASANSYATLTNSFYTLISFTMLLLLIASFVIRHNLQQEKGFRESSILEAKSKEMEQFTYITSHELRHPLLTIQSYIKLFDEEFSDKLDETGRHYLKSISGLTKQMDILILGLFDYSRLSKIKKLKTLNCNELIETVLTELNSIIQASNAKIVIASLPTISASPLEIRQLFICLLTNAIKFKKTDLAPELNISAKKDGKNYIFEFRDNGIGIEEKDTKKIFNIFKRLHRTEEYEGVGLGLAYCKKIVELHHGKIWVTSKPGIGSSFYFTIKR